MPAGWRRRATSIAGRRPLRVGMGPRAALPNNDHRQPKRKRYSWMADRLTRPTVSIAEAYDIPAPRLPLVPPHPPRAPQNMTVLGRLSAMRKSMIGTWGQPAYEEDIIQGRFFGHGSFILNTADAI